MVVNPVKEIFNVYPNPNPNSTNNPFYINYISAKNESAECTLYNMLGQNIDRFSVENNVTKTIYDNKLKSGIYFFSLKDYHGTRVKKIIVL